MHSRTRLLVKAQRCLEAARKYGKHGPEKLSILSQGRLRWQSLAVKICKIAWALRGNFPQFESLKGCL